ncbi:MAG: branched-chain amino acid ABC transporter permease [Candidatus Rokubacteria bacterium]|nr:branched-chain amino acid ABC transporter permease [Candidatus Rokubacteria bacterium]
MEIFVEQLLNGLILGSQYALVAVGLSLIFGIVQIVNFAHGEFFMLGAYAFSIVYPYDGPIPYPVAVVLTVAIMFVFGVGYERVVIRPILDRGWHAHIIATLATSIVFVNAAMWIWGTSPRTTPTTLSKTTIRVLFVTISWQRLAVFAVTALTFWLLHLFIQRTRTGKAMRAMSQNREACAVHGIDVRRIASLTFGIGAALAGLAGSLIAPLFNVLPTMGSLVTLKAFAAVVMGGMGSVTGAISAAFIIGVTEALAAGYGWHVNIDTAYKDAFPFGMMILVLLLRPHGLFGRRVGI